MKNRYPLAALALLTIIASTPRAEAQGAPAAAAAAARRQKLAAQQAAVIAAAKKNAAATPTATPTAVATINRPAPTAAPTTPPATPTVTAAPTTTAAPKPSATAATSAAPATSTSAAPVATAKPETTTIALDIEALRKSRPDRRHAEFVDLQSRWGSLLNDPRSADELKLHAQRLAYLQRIRALGAKDPTFVKGVDALITKEETRDSDALNALRSGALPTAALPAPGASK